MRIGVDIDDVLYPFQQELSRLLVAEGLAHCTVEAAHPSWDFYAGWSMTRQEFWDHYHRLAEDRLLWQGECEYDTDAALYDLWARNFDIILVTARSERYREATESWLHDEWIRYDELHFAHDKTTVPVDMFIDDRLENYDQLDAAGVEVYLLNKPWNQVPGDDRRRVDTFAEFAQIVIKKEFASYAA